MSETQMPAVEATVADEKETNSYEFAFHILPTVAEGEVPGVVEKLKELITKANGEIFDEEAPQRFDLAYEIIKYLEGRNRKFSSAYFGWIRFRLDSGRVTELTEDLNSSKYLLRFLLVKLTKVEEANPFRFHDSISDRKIRTISSEEMAEIESEAADEEETETEGGEIPEEDENVRVAEIVTEAADDGQEAEETV